MKKNSVLYKYFISYTAIILAVCLIASFSFFFFAFGQYNESIEESNIARTRAASADIDNDFEECVLISRKLVTNWDGATNIALRRLDTAVEIKGALQDYVTNSGNAADIILIPNMSESKEVYYYNTTGITSYRHFDRYYGFDKITHQWISENIGNISAPVLIPTTSRGTAAFSRDVNVLLIPAKLFITNDRFDAVMFVFQRDDIVHKLTDAFVEETANTMITSSNGEVLMADSVIAENISLYTEGIPDGKRLYTEKSSMFDWSYSIFVDESVSGGYFGTTGFVVLLCISVVLAVIGIMAAFVAARHSYKPIKGLMNIIPYEFHSEENEFSVMQKIFTEMNKKNEMLMENIEKLKDNNPDSLSVLLMGDNGKTDSRTLSSELGLPCDSNGYVLGIFEIDDDEYCIKSENFEKQLCECVKSTITLPSFVKGLPGRGFYVMVAALESADDSERQELKEMISNAQERIRNTLGTTATCTISRTLCSLSDASEKIYSVICATNYRVMYGYDSIIDMELLDRQYVNIDTDFFNCFFEFYSNLKAGYNESAVDNLMQMKEIIQESFSPDVFRLAYINIVHCFAQYFDEEEILPELVAVPKTVEVAFENIEKLTQRYFEIQSKNSRLKHEVLKIVKTEYTDSELSITSIAERLDISNSYLRKYFKDNMGITLYAYIDEMRITHAKRLLLETDLPIKEIARASGYIDINNFNRKFKAKTGKTPTAYKTEGEEEVEI